MVAQLNNLRAEEFPQKRTVRRQGLLPKQRRLFPLVPAHHQSGQVRQRQHRHRLSPPLGQQVPPAGLLGHLLHGLRLADRRLGTLHGLFLVQPHLLHQLLKTQAEKELPQQPPVRRPAQRLFGDKIQGRIAADGAQVVGLKGALLARLQLLFHPGLGLQGARLQTGIYLC